MGFPSFLDLFARAGCNAAPALLQETSPAPPGPRTGAGQHGQRDAGKSAP